MTKPENAKHRPADQMRTPNAATPPPTARPRATGNRNESRRLVTVDLRHASNGPTPVSNNSERPIGSIQRLKNGAPTVIRSPRTASLNVGNIVANRTKNALNSRIQLL